MKGSREALGWALFLILAGVFLVIKNLGVFGEWGDLIWGALFGLAGLGFVIWFLTGVQHWWRAIPGFTLLGIGAVQMLGWRDVDLRDWQAPIVLFATALGFWAILLARKEHWWALVPAGVLTVVGLLFGVWTQLDPATRLAVLYAGLGLVFLLLYAIRFDQRDARWAAIPSAALLLLGAVTLAGSANLTGIIATWWPAFLVVAGVLLGVLALIRQGSTVEPAAPMMQEEEILPPAPGASVSSLPTAEELAASRPMPWETPAERSAKDEPVDIYEVIKKQPKD